MIACVHNKASNAVSTDSNNEDTKALSNVEKDSSACTNSELFNEAIEKFNTTAISLCATLPSYCPANQNRVFSPLGIINLLALTGNCAKGRTQKEINQFLGLNSMDALRQLEKIASIDTTFIQLHQHFILTTQPNVPIAEDFLNSICNRIEVRKQTGAISLGSTILENFISFSGQWAQPFELFKEKKEFVNSSGKKIEADMMHMQRISDLYDCNDFYMLKIPYKGERMSMYVAMYNGLKPIGDLPAKMLKALGGSGKKLRGLVDIWLPRFRVECDIPLKEPLKSLGIQRLFGMQAELDQLSNVPLYVDKFGQRCVVDVTEKGTTAEAETQEVFIPKGTEPVTSFHVNHPFAFIIRDDLKGIVLFAGFYYGDPKGKPYKDAEHVVPDDNYDVVEITPEGKVIPRQEPVIPDYLDPNTIVDVVEQMPSFPGGQRALMDYIASNIRYPKSYNKVDQRIIVKFVVERDGSLSNITILKGSSEQALNDEALRVVRGMPKWIPGKQYGIERRVVYTVPVNFKKE